MKDLALDLSEMSYGALRAITHVGQVEGQVFHAPHDFCSP